MSNFFAPGNSSKRSVKGFSLLEVLVSLFVLSIGFLGVTGLSVSALRNSMLQRDATVASMLVQEGIELVYNIRDTNIAKGQDAFTGISSGASYRIDSVSPVLIGSTVDQLAVSLSGGLYGHDSSGSPTKFSRKIIVSGSSETRTVTSVVVWGESAFPGTIDETNCGIENGCSFTQTILQQNN